MVASSADAYWRLDAMPEATADVAFPADPMAFYRWHGFSAMRGVVDPDLVAQAAEEARDLYASVWDVEPGPMAEKSHRRHPAWRLDEATPALRAIIGNPVIAETLSQAYGAPARFAAFEIFVRTPGQQGTDWHTDHPYIPVSGEVIHVWLPLIATESGRSLNYVTDLGSGPVGAHFAGMRPGDIAFHQYDVAHSGQTYPDASVALSLVTFVDGSVLEPGEARASSLGRNAFRERVFPDLAWGERVDTQEAPLMHDLVQGR